MKIPERTANQNKRPALELISINLYSTGKKKVYTDHFYKSMNKNFGIQLKIRNNTKRLQSLKIGGCVCDHYKHNYVRWIGTQSLPPNTVGKYEYYVSPEKFDSMNPGKYIAIFWINDKKIMEKPFTISYK